MSNELDRRLPLAQGTAVVSLVAVVACPFGALGSGPATGHAPLQVKGREENRAKV